LPASLVLSIMILPRYRISREAMAAVPKRLAEPLTAWVNALEVIFRVTLPTAIGGISGAGVGSRARVGETMAWRCSCATRTFFGWSCFRPAIRLAALLANHFPEAGKVGSRALMYPLRADADHAAVTDWLVHHAAHDS